MARSSIVITPGKIWLPQQRFTLNWKVLITDSDSTETDVTDYVLNVNIDWPATTALARCTLELDNFEGRYLDKFSGGEKLEVWAEYDDTPGVPTNKIYRGKIDSAFYNVTNSKGFTLKIESRQVPEANDIFIIEQYDNALISDAIIDICQKYLSGIVTTTNVETTTTRVTTNFKNVSPWKAIAELLQRAEQDGYIDTDLDLHTFITGSVATTKDVVSLGQNVLSVNGYGLNNLNVKNRVMVYGKEDNNLSILKTEESSSSQSDLWQKDMVVSDNSLLSMESVQDSANYYLSKHTDLVTNSGKFTILGSPRLNPGEEINTSIPYCNVSTENNIMRITHDVSASGFNTALVLNSQAESVGDLFKQRIDAESRLQADKNLNYMENSLYYDFDEADTPWTLTNCEVNDGVLQLTTGQTEGICTFTSVTADNNVTHCELRIHSNWPNTEIDTYEVSNDGGASWMTITPGTLETFASTGKFLRFKIKLNSDATRKPAYEGISLLFK